MSLRWPRSLAVIQSMLVLLCTLLSVGFCIRHAGPVADSNLVSRASADRAGNSEQVNDSIPEYEYSLSVVQTSGPIPGSREDDVPAVEKGSVVGQFANCSAPVVEGSGCFISNPYEDRITFRINFLRNATLGRLRIHSHAPIVSAAGGRAEPVVSSLDVHMNEPFALFTVKYMCSAPNDGSSPVNASSDIKLTMSTVPEKETDLVWGKICGSGTFKPVLFGYRDHEDHSVLFNGDGTHGEDKEVGLEVSPHDLATVLTLALRAGVDSLDFLSPHVTSSDPFKAAFVVRSSLMGGTIWAENAGAAEISIMYECKESVRAEFTVTIGIPPWNNLTASWTKDCGGHVPRSLLIGTSMTSNFNVLQDGELDPAYNITDKTDILEARLNRKKILGMGTHSSLFYISNSDEASEIHIQSVTLTLSPPDTMIAVIETPRMAPLLGTGYIGKGGATLGRREVKRLQMHFYCRKGGSVIVLVTLATLLFQNVEFGFIKECVPGIAHQHHALTAGSLMSGLLIAFSFTSVLACCFVIRKRRRDTEGQAVAASVERTVKGKYTLVDNDERLEY